MSGVNPPSEPSSFPSEQRGFSDQEIDKLKPVVKKLLFGDRDAKDEDIQKLFKIVKESIQPGKDLPEQYKKTSINYFYLLVKLSSGERNDVIEKIYNLGIDKLTPKLMSQCIREVQEASNQPLKRSHGETVPAAVSQQNPTDERLRKAKQEEASSTPAASSSARTVEEEFGEIFQGMLRHSPNENLKRLDWEKLKKQTLELNSQDACRAKSFIHEACWLYLHLQDQQKLKFLLQYLKSFSPVTPNLLTRAIKILGVCSLEFPNLLQKILKEGNRNENETQKIFEIYRRLNLGSAHQVKVGGIFDLFKRLSVFNHQKWEELFEAALNRSIRFGTDESRFEFSTFILTFALRPQDISKSVSKESIHSFFDALDAQNDLYARYAKASLRDQTIFQTMVILDYKIPSLSEYNEAIRRAEQRFTFSSVRRMLSESIFRKHFCENEEAAAHIIVERLSQANIALPNGASVALTTPEEVIQILTEALQAHIIYAERLEQYAKGPRKEKPKYPVLEAGQDNIPHPHLAPINYHFFSIKEKRLYHAMSLPLSMQPKSWGGIEFGLVFEENEFRILHCSPLSPLPPKQ